MSSERRGLLSRPVSIRTSLIRATVSLIVVFSIALLASIGFNVSKSRQALTVQIIDGCFGQVEAELNRFFRPVEATLEMTGRWARREIVVLDDSEFLMHFFAPTLEQFPQVVALRIADLEGREFVLMPDGEGWTTAERDSDGRTQVITWRNDEFYSDAYELRASPTSESWFKEAVAAAGESGWAAPDRLVTTGRPGMTARRLVDTPKGPLVVGFDVELRAISDLTSNLRPTENGMLVVVASDQRTLGLPASAAFETAAARDRALLSRPEELGVPEVRDGLLAWQEAGAEVTGAVRYDSEDEVWWGAARSYELAGGQILGLGAVLPEDDLLAEARAQRRMLLWISLAVLAGAIAVAVWLARSYSRPLHELVDRARRIQDLDLVEASGKGRVRSRIREVEELGLAQEQMRQALESFSRYVPTDLVRELLRRGEAAQIGGEGKTVTILFTDIRGFTSIAEKMSAEALTAQMSEYFDELCEALHRNGATIDKFIGDSVMAFWGAPNDDRDHAGHAMQGILEGRSVLDSLTTRWSSEGRPPLSTRFGVATGRVVVGNVGASSRLSYTALGDTVNLASRLENLNEAYGTWALVSQPTRDAAGEHYLWREVDTVAVKGRTQGVTVFEPLGVRDAVTPELVAITERYERALAEYRERRFDRASDLLAEFESVDPPSSHLRARCQRFQARPPSEEWDGVAR